MYNDKTGVEVCQLKIPVTRARIRRHRRWSLIRARVTGIFNWHTETGFVFIIRLSKNDFQWIYARHLSCTKLFFFLQHLPEQVCLQKVHSKRGSDLVFCCHSTNWCTFCDVKFSPCSLGKFNKSQDWLVKVMFGLFFKRT